MDWKRASDDGESKKIDSRDAIEQVEDATNSSTERGNRRSSPLYSSTIDESAWLKQQGELPAALRRSLLDSVLSRLTDKAARAECHRLFAQLKGDETKFLSQIEHKFTGYAHKFGVSCSLEQIFLSDAEKYAKRCDQLQPPSKQNLERLERAFEYNQSTRDIYAKFISDYPDVQGVYGWEKEVNSLDKSLHRLARDYSDTEFDGLQLGAKDLRAEIQGAIPLGPDLRQVRLEVSRNGIDTEFDYVIERDGRITYGDGKNYGLFSPDSTTCTKLKEQALKQLAAIKYMDGEIDPENPLEYRFFKGVTSQVADVFEQQCKIKVIGERYPSHLSTPQFEGVDR